MVVSGKKRGPRMSERLGTTAEVVLAQLNGDTPVEGDWKPVWGDPSGEGDTPLLVFTPHGDCVDIQLL